MKQHSMSLFTGYQSLLATLLKHVTVVCRHIYHSYISRAGALWDTRAYCCCIHHTQLWQVPSRMRILPPPRSSTLLPRWPSHVLRLTSLTGDEELVKQILEEDPDQCNVTSKDGATPLMIAALMGHLTIAEILIQKGADINYQERNSGWTALMQATFHRYSQVYATYHQDTSNRSLLNCL